MLLSTYGTAMLLGWILLLDWLKYQLQRKQGPERGFVVFTMNYLVQGGQDGERFDLLIQFTKRQGPMAKAMRAYLVTGLSMARAADSAGVNLSHLSTALKKLEKQAALVEQIKLHDLKHLTAK